MAGTASRAQCKEGPGTLWYEILGSVRRHGDGGTCFCSSRPRSGPQETAGMKMLCCGPARWGSFSPYYAFLYLALRYTGSKHTLQRWRMLVVSLQSTSGMISAFGVSHFVCLCPVGKERFLAQVVLHLPGSQAWEKNETSINVFSELSCLFCDK